MKTESIVERFEGLGREDVPESGMTAKQIILDVLNANPGQFFPKSTFVEQLKDIEGVAHSAPAIHGALNKLVKENLIEKSSSGRTNYYRISK